MILKITLVNEDIIHERMTSLSCWRIQWIVFSLCWEGVYIQTYAFLANPHFLSKKTAGETRFSS